MKMKFKKAVLLSLYVLLAIGAGAQTNHIETNLKCFFEMPDSFEPNTTFGKIMKVKVSAVEKIDVTIFNKWGQKVLEAGLSDVHSGNMHFGNKDLMLIYSAETEGKHTDLSSGTYYYSTNLVCANGSLLSEEGELRLIRTSHK
jgi:hypothetical protein